MKNKLYKRLFCLAIVIVFSLAIYSVAESQYTQYKMKTLSRVCPGAEYYYPDRYLSSFISDYSNDYPDTAIVLGPIPFKSKIIYAGIIKGEYTSDSSDSSYCKLYGGLNVGTGSSAITDSSLVLINTYTELTILTASDVDTLTPGSTIMLKCVKGNIDSSGNSDSLMSDFQITIGLEIIE